MEKTTLKMKMSSLLDYFVLLIKGVKTCLCPERSRKYERKQSWKHGGAPGGGFRNLESEDRDLISWFQCKIYLGTFKMQI